MSHDTTTICTGTTSRTSRLGLRLKEFAHAFGISMPTVWRRIKAGDIHVTYIGRSPIITHAEMRRLGLIGS